MKMQDLQHWRELILAEYTAGRMEKETARAKCRVITKAIESMAKKGRQEGLR